MTMGRSDRNSNSRSGSFIQDICLLNTSLLTAVNVVDIHH